MSPNVWLKPPSKCLLKIKSVEMQKELQGAYPKELKKRDFKAEKNDYPYEKGWRDLDKSF